ncbi:nuclease-related domain-containing protein [Cytobacillus purgationiresistens]|uniref:NERD domain-containing protein n=1 Tax=Cytobacillus purgationiresistens TaxID=863449 RepID=A0ABU0AM41_9BACI|nr:nuclease-related domain-containing protein [Cytobacillus purgationiresistens]MDQ0272324.1 hypothetical protein [Cytobacillus purgationiresistens]
MRQTEALLRRIREEHPLHTTILEDLRKLSAGYNGEKNTQYYLDFFEEPLIYHNIQLEEIHSFFQIDFRLIHPRFVFIFECKNIFGELQFDSTFNQMIRTTNEKSEALLIVFLKVSLKAIIKLNNKSSILLVS